MKIEIYKKNQGRYTRGVTLLAVVGIALAGAYVLSEQLAAMSAYLQYGIPVLVVAAIAAATFWFVNRPRSADFLIATEGEMKKVSWSSKKEIFGSTKVVIVTAFIMAAILFGADQVFINLFRALNVVTY
ncbi:MAG: preprotein translocase subunit SecE [Planctomycetota bacterium]